MSIILGIDPGSRITGYGVIAVKRNQMVFINTGTIKTAAGTLISRLEILFNSVQMLIQQFQPTMVAAEQIFVSHNARSALLLGQARGAVLAAVAQAKLPLHEYTARQVKKAIVGYGAADKIQMQSMVQRLLKLNAKPSADAADALAIAICHANSMKWQRLTQTVTA